MKNLKQKLLVFFVGLFAVILLFEVGLRIEGMVYTKIISLKHNRVNIQKGDNYVIFCLGDSFTFGLGAAYEDSYPRQLEGMLNSRRLNNKRFIVINGGVVGENSSQALKRLGKELKKHNPDLLIVLVGVKKESLGDSNYCLFADKKEMGIKKYYCGKIDYFLSKLRTYRLLKMLISDIKSSAMIRKEAHVDVIKKEPARKGPPVDGREGHLNIVQNEDKSLNLGRVYLSQGKFKLAEEEAKSILKINPQSENGHLLLASTYTAEEAYGLARVEADKALKINHNSSSAYLEIGHSYYYEGRNRPEIRDKNLALAMEMLKKAIEINPKEKDAYLLLGEIYFFEQNKANLAIEVTKKLLEIDPKNEEYIRRMNIYSPPSVDRKIIDKLLAYDLKNIIELAAEKRIRVILLGYPDKNFHDDVRMQVAKENSVVFIDMRSKFQDLLKKYSRNDFFSNDSSHCNKNGYRVMAEEIYKNLNSYFEMTVK